MARGFNVLAGQGIRRSNAKLWKGVSQDIRQSWSWVQVLIVCGILVHKHQPATIMSSWSSKENSQKCILTWESPHIPLSKALIPSTSLPSSGTPPGQMNSGTQAQHHQTWFMRTQLPSPLWSQQSHEVTILYS